jgi:hypothetical protein
MPQKPLSGRNSAFARQRLMSQGLAGKGFKNPADAVAHMGGIQAQDYPGGVWSIGLRVPGSGSADIERAIAGRKVIRTWAMRGTLHFLAAKDIRWMLELLSKGIIAANALRYSQLRLDGATLSKSQRVLASVLAGGKQMTRGELVAALESRGIWCSGQRAPHILQRAALDRLICFGPKREKQFTFTLFDEWVRQTRPLSPEEALGELARRYFKSHGPATVNDFMWWSGLRGPDAREALEIARPGLVEDTFEGKSYWISDESELRKPGSHGAYLLPGFDDFLLGYKDRTASLDKRHASRLGAGGILNPTIVIDGKVVGVWRRTLRRNRVIVETALFTRLDMRQKKELGAAVARYRRFVGPAGTEGVSEDNP